MNGIGYKLVVFKIIVIIMGFDYREDHLNKRTANLLVAKTTKEIVSSDLVSIYINLTQLCSILIYIKCGV